MSSKLVFGGSSKLVFFFFFGGGGVSSKSVFGAGSSELVIAGLSKLVSVGHQSWSLGVIQVGLWGSSKLIFGRGRGVIQVFFFGGGGVFQVDLWGHPSWSLGDHPS